MPPADTQSETATDAIPLAVLQARWLILTAGVEVLFLSGLLMVGHWLRGVFLADRNADHAFAITVFFLLAVLTYLAVMLPIRLEAGLFLPRRRGAFGGTGFQPVPAQLKKLCHEIIVPIAARAGLPVGLLLICAAGYWPVAVVLLAAGALAWWCINHRPAGAPVSNLPAELAYLYRFARQVGLQDAQVILRPAGTLDGCFAEYQYHRTGPIIYLRNDLPTILAGPELLAVFAHEVGHHFVHADWRVRLAQRAVQLAFMAAMVIMTLAVLAAITGPADWVVMIPLWLLLLRIVVLAITPLVLAMSRWRERLANRWAMRATGDAVAFAGAMTKLAATCGIGKHPAGILEKLLIAGHPSLDEVLKQARHAASDVLKTNDKI